MPFCDVADNIELYFEDFGDGTPIVFTSSGNSTHGMWGSQVRIWPGRSVPSPSTFAARVSRASREPDMR